MIQPNAYVPGNLSHKSKRQESQPRVEAQMEDARTSTSSQRLSRTFNRLIESPEALIAAVIPSFRSKKSPTMSSRDIPDSVQALVYARKSAGVGAYANPLDRENVLISSSEEALRPRKERGPSERLESNVYQREIPTDKILVKKPEHFNRG
ncbi:hypothetical protein O181_070605 [Austropuccinia psidii MF-1]|uniref:Uncharacterized protein n=1 Tax=Austropuccinia psidii MF-1 TaxID=1389203 RepID=A0A9Q3I985_9BASI|nr:hypothetical protein [Austropuccinia psidii MF-1]